MPPTYTIEALDYANLRPGERDQIQHVYTTVLHVDMGIAFDPSIDRDFAHPEEYYVDACNGAYAVVRQHNEGDKESYPGTIVGTVAIRRITPTAPLPELFVNDPVSHKAIVEGKEYADGSVCELKRMFLLPEARGCGLSNKLLHFILDEAVRRGYAAVVLDTRVALGPANALYEKVGFVDIGRYNDNPRPDRFLGVLIANGGVNEKLRSFMARFAVSAPSA